MEFFIALIVIAIVFDLAAMHWGHDSRHEVNSQEWERRRRWAAFH